MFVSSAGRRVPIHCERDLAGARGDRSRSEAGACLAAVEARGGRGDRQGVPTLRCAPAAFPTHARVDANLNPPDADRRIRSEAALIRDVTGHSRARAFVDTPFHVRCLIPRTAGTRAYSTAKSAVPMAAPFLKQRNGGAHAQRRASGRAGLFSPGTAVIIAPTPGRRFPARPSIVDGRGREADGAAGIVGRVRATGRVTAPSALGITVGRPALTRYQFCPPEFSETSSLISNLVKRDFVDSTRLTCQSLRNQKRPFRSDARQQLDRRHSRLRPAVISRRRHLRHVSGPASRGFFYPPESKAGVPGHRRRFLRSPRDGHRGLDAGLPTNSTDGRSFLPASIAGSSSSVSSPAGRDRDAQGSAAIDHGSIRHRRLRQSAYTHFAERVRFQRVGILPFALA